LVHAEKYRTEDKLKTDTLQKLNWGWRLAAAVPAVRTMNLGMFQPMNGKCLW